MVEKLASVEKARQRAQTKANVFSEVFGNPQGKEVLDALKDQFDQEILCVDSEYKTVIRAGQRDVIRWIEEVIKRGSRNVEG